MDFFDKWGSKYLPILLQILVTILVVSHWYRGLDWIPIFLIWCISLGLSISPILDIIYGNKHDDMFDWDYFKSKEARDAFFESDWFNDIRNKILDYG